MKHFILKFVTALMLMSSEAYSQTIANNFFKEINSIDVNVTISGDSEFCGVRKEDVRNTVSYILSNTPFKKIDVNSSEILSFNIVVLNVKNKNGVSLGCSVATTVELLRFVNFKGKSSLVTVWSDIYLNVGMANEVGGNISSLVEKLTKEFIARWVEQR